METGSRRSAAEVKRCSVADEHDGPVLDAVWLTVQPGWVVTGGADATVKVWDAKNATTVWTSQQVFNSVIPDSCIKVAGSAQHGFIVGVFKSGHVRIWAGFDFTQSNILADDIKEIVVDNPIRTSTEGYDSSANHDVTTLDHDSSPIICQSL
jgi:WD40 repeat protein